MDDLLSNYKKQSDGSYLDSYGNQIKPPIDIGHGYGYEQRRLNIVAKELNMTQAELNEYVNTHPQHFRRKHPTNPYCIFQT